MLKKPLFEADTHIAKAGRAVFASEICAVRFHQAALLRDADVTAVHETRKAIRRTFTAFKLSAPYYEPGILKKHRRGLKKLMRRLGRCRDVAVFLDKLATYGEVHDPLPELVDHWRLQKAGNDEELRRYLNKPKTARFLDAYEQFTRTPDLSARHDLARFVPNKAKHLAPLLIYERVATIRAYEDRLVKANVELLHQLRIQFKELRYTLRYFAPLMGAEVIPVEATLEALQDVLGDLNDAVVALRLLAASPVEKEILFVYRQAKEREIARLIIDFSPLWSEFNAPKWRRRLAASVAVL